MSLFDRSAIEAAAARASAEPVAPTAELVDAWRQLHHAAQLASEVGKAWATPRADDSHSAFVFCEGELLGTRVEAPMGFRAALRVRDLTLRLVADGGAVLASESLDGVALADGMRWIRGEAARLAGPPRQPAIPAPDLPPHAVLQGAPFSVRAAELAALARLLGGADALLRAVAPSVTVWPHHFDMATLLETAPQRTIGVGLAVPDALEPSGYWYVSPWAAEPPSSASTVWPALACGRWIERGGALRMAALPLGLWATLGDANARRAALAGFTVTALDASANNLARADG